MELAIAAIFQNEAPYLKEWIEFHRAAGVEYFHLFDNLSQDNPQQVLQPYIDKKVVRLTPWPLASSDVYEWTEIQCLAYERALHAACGKTKWLAFLDADEFLFSPNTSLLCALTPFESYGGVAVNWQVFGTSQIAKLSNRLPLLQQLIRKAPSDHVTNHHIKSIVRPERVKSCPNAHSMEYQESFYQVDTRHARFEGTLSPTIQLDQLRINHYTLRDEHYFQTQKIKRLQKWWPNDLANMQQRYSELNQVEDREILQFLPLDEIFL